MKDISSLSYSKWRGQYHIVFVPKYCRKEIYGKLKADIGQILRKLCEQKGVEIIEAHACPDHVHMLVSIPPNIRISDRNQLQEDIASDQVSLKEFIDPFTGSKNTMA